MTETAQKIDDGGPAFASWDFGENQHHPGMSTRMWLAGMASDKDVNQFMGKEFGGGGMAYRSCRERSRVAARFLYADAMIAASKKDTP